MDEEGKRRVVIVGGGTAGWMTAAALVHQLGPLVSVRLVESAEIGIVGVGEATFPHLRLFLRRLGIEEAAFMAATHATYKLGIVFNDFGALGEEYMHGFAGFGEPVAGVPFHHYWLRMHREAQGSAIGDYSIAVAAARARRFHPPCDDLGGEGAFSYAYQFDATRFAPFLRDFACGLGAERIEATVRHVARDAERGDVTALELADGSRVEGDLFIDCSGFRSLLLGETLGEDWESWSDWLPCDRAVAMPCTRPPGEIEPFTRAIGMSSGWRWRIPLQHRLGNGYVFSSAYLSEDAATAELAGVLEGTPLAEPRILKFRPGRRRRAWAHNVIGIGLASGFLEPMESTSIYLVQVAIDWLLELFPLGAVEEGDRTTFNALIDFEYARIRDFLILHYHATRRDDSPFWNRMRTMELPESLAERLALWRRSARVAHYGRGPFLEPSWVAVLLGQGIRPDAWDARAQLPDRARLEGAMAALRADVDRRVGSMPDHAAYLHDLIGGEALDG
ncbi:tryptophan halogenase family protein [Sphingomonas sp. R1]|uniref:tryptophan halogenase family protein n=1 Tax=Sphingomonas sp. R1 TaxID=399176 RepID=UPI0022241025|nr:tryptophan halogenase family protein [Sphingomonas sp. R1]UYY77095.1 tryptophan 7-halogenase [Sphingomonas sp. R1]